jgi:alpha-beta hydrolase superfamily lysophospholipase
MLFKDPLHDDFGTWPLAYIPYGGADFGEIEAVARAVGDGDDASFHGAWNEAAERLTNEATASLANGHRASARDLYLRASVFHAASCHPLYGEPVDPRLLSAFRRQVEAFDKGLALSDPPVEPLAIPFADTPLPAYLLPASGRAHEVRPLLILTNGYDATITDLYFASAAAASRRGYHCLMFDGPGQGALLFEHGVRLRPDWETVIAAVVDFALAQPIVDPARIALSGWSLGGYLAPRGASGNPHIAALIADPGVASMVSDAYRTVAVTLGASREAAADLGTLDQVVLDRLQAAIQSDRRLKWNIEQRGFWVHGVDNLRDYLRSAELFTLEGRVELIRCPTLLTMAQDDDLAAGTPALFDALSCPKTLMRFSADEGAGEHCEMKNRSLLNRRTLDWLDEQFAR